MKKTIMSLAVVSALFSGAAMATSAANDSSYATLNFSGRVTSNLCQVATDSAVTNVDLGEVTVSQLNGGNQRSTPQSFNVALSNCDTSVKTISYTLSDNNAADSVRGYLIPSSGDTSAAGVGVYITKSDGTPVEMSKTISHAVETDGENALPSQKLSFTAYIAPAADLQGHMQNISAGNVSAQGTLTIKATADAL
ncbi:TPA: type 1 fimbrial protein [Escherichia coli]|nr:type 1 fimbrial protein [Escherichia coli]HAW8215079.1 type 1 fimbrial protein [Escherichia coli]HDL9596359.1 type 1 fimbrial protein [Escherichia coli]HDL9639955.1 type 1 fimbrial protein [Escherichia coli]HED5924153.1 type 1 fimbrial protein [Escherichia coli]